VSVNIVIGLGLNIVAMNNSYDSCKLPYILVYKSSFWDLILT